MDHLLRPTPRPLLLAAATLLGLLALAGQPAAARAQNPALRGIQISQVRRDTTTAQINNDLDRAHSLGARVVRTEFSWALLEPSSAGQHDAGYVSKMDALVAGAGARGMKVLPTVWQTPCWDTTAPPSAGACPNAATVAYAPRDDAGYAEAVSWMAARYASSLAGIEIWNEPDLIGGVYWRAPDVAGAYASLLEAAYPAVKRAAPAVPVLGGSLIGGNGAFLRALYARGIKGFYDGLAIHHYDLVLAAIRTTHAIMLAAGDHAPLWLTEFGLSTCLPARRSGATGQTCVSPGQQARGIDDVMRALRSAAYLHAALIYSLDDRDGGHFGVWGKPAQTVTHRVLTGYLPPVRAPTIRLVRRSGHVSAAGSAPFGDLVEIRVFLPDTRTASLIATILPDRAGRYTLALPAVLSRLHLRLDIRQLGSGRRVTRLV